MEEYIYTSTHPLGHTGPVTGTLYLFYIIYIYIYTHTHTHSLETFIYSVPGTDKYRSYLVCKGYLLLALVS